jgi:hypothetical protein
MPNRITAAASIPGNTITSSTHRYGSGEIGPMRAGSCHGIAAASIIPAAVALKAVKAARNEPAKRPNRYSRFSTAVLNTISSIRCSRSRTTALAQKTAMAKTAASDASPSDSAMLYGEFR